MLNSYRRVAPNLTRIFDYVPELGTQVKSELVPSLRGTKVPQLPMTALHLRPYQRPRLQYLSDVHVDHLQVGHLPRVHVDAPYLAICGDLGKPTHPNFFLFLKKMAEQFHKVFFVAGNHDFDCTPLYIPKKVQYYQPIIRTVCNYFANVHYLEQNSYQLGSHTMLLGTPLWSRPALISSPSGQLAPKYQLHIDEHQRQVRWLESMLKKYRDYEIYVLTHNVPSFQLIEKKYLEYGQHRTSWFATDLEYMIKPPVKAWLCGHSHSVLHHHINGVYCGLNAYGYSNEHKSKSDLAPIESKSISLDD